MLPRLARQLPRHRLPRVLAAAAAPQLPPRWIIVGEHSGATADHVNTRSFLDGVEEGALLEDARVALSIREGKGACVDLQLSLLANLLMRVGLEQRGRSSESMRVGVKRRARSKKRGECMKSGEGERHEQGARESN